MQSQIAMQGQRSVLQNELNQIKSEVARISEENDKSVHQSTQSLLRKE